MLGVGGGGHPLRWADPNDSEIKESGTGFYQPGELGNPPMAFNRVCVCVCISLFVFFFFSFFAFFVKRDDRWNFKTNFALSFLSFGGGAGSSFFFFFFFAVFYTSPIRGTVPRVLIIQKFWCTCVFFVHIYSLFKQAFIPLKGAKIKEKNFVQIVARLNEIKNYNYILYSLL